MAKSSKTSDFSEVFLMYSFGFQLIKFGGIGVRFFLTLFCTFCGLRLFRQPETTSKEVVFAFTKGEVCEWF